MIVDLFRIGLVDGMFDFSSHKGIGIPLEGAQAGPCAEVNLLTAIHRARIVRWVFQLAAARGFILWVVLVLINIVIR